jgi:hypothetical protein
MPSWCTTTSTQVELILLMAFQRQLPYHSLAPSPFPIFAPYSHTLFLSWNVQRKHMYGIYRILNKINSLNDNFIIFLFIHHSLIIYFRNQLQISNLIPFLFSLFNYRCAHTSMKALEYSIEERYTEGRREQQRKYMHSTEKRYSIKLRV